MAFSYSARRIRQRPAVRGLQTGGYARAEIPEINDMSPTGLYGNVANPSGDPTHVAGGMSALEYNSALAKQGAAGTDQARMQANARGGLDAVVQGIKTTPADKRWDAFFGGLQQQGVDKLQSGAAAGMDRGPSTYDMKTGTSYQEAKPGFFDTQVAKQGHAYDPRDAQAGEMPADAPYAQAQQQGAQTYASALSGLRQAPYDPHAPIVKRRHRYFLEDE